MKGILPADHNSSGTHTKVSACSMSAPLEVPCSIRAATRGFTLVEIIVVVCIILVLAALLMPVVKNAIASGQSGKCISQLHQIGNIFGMFESEHGYFVPAGFTNPTQNWYQGSTPLDVYCAGSGGINGNISALAVCPSVQSSTGYHGSGMQIYGVPYFMNYNLMVNPATPPVSLNAINGRTKSSLVMLLDESPTNTGSFGGNDQGDYGKHPGTQHLGKINIMWADGHVTSEVWTKLQTGDFRFTAAQPNH